MTVAIDRNIPVAKSGGGRDPKYPWRDMSIGDSFFVEGVDSGSVRSMAYLAGKRTGFKFSCRTVDGGVRVWRVE